MVMMENPLEKQMIINQKNVFGVLTLVGLSLDITRTRSNSQSIDECDT